jgi:uncharacterized coiled-coil protein SlyX
MFGYRLIKEVEIEKLQKDLEEYNKIAEAQRSLIAELESKVKEQESTIANLTKPKKVKKDSVKEETPVKKVRRNIKKTVKKED